MRKTPRLNPPEPVPDRVRAEEERRIREALETYPTQCVECGEALKNRHPDDPPVHSGECEDQFFGRYEPT